MLIVYIIIALIVLLAGCKLLGWAFDLDNLGYALFFGVIAAVLIVGSLCIPFWPLWGWMLNPLNW